MKAIFIIIFSLHLFIANFFAQIGEQYFINTQKLNLRLGPDQEYPILMALSHGETVILIEKEENGWWFVSYNDNIKGYVFSAYLSQNENVGWEQKNYQSGETPECENVSPKYDYSLDNYLKVNVGSSTDVVIKVMNVSYQDNVCIRIIYVRGGDSFLIKNIPEGKYYLKIAYGKDYRKKIIDNKCYVKFMKNAIYEKGTDILDFYKIAKPDEVVGNSVYKNWEVPSYELSLDVLATSDYNDFNAKTINESEFNR
jgi:hypothetical protein